MKEVLLQELLRQWGVSKTAQVILLSISAGLITFVIAVNVIPNTKNIILEEESEEDDYENESKFN